jgi:DNA polymerase I
VSGSDLALLRPFLPAAQWSEYAGLLDSALDDVRVIDLEWDEVTGALHTIGVGNDRVVVQLAWRPDPAWQLAVRNAIRHTIERGVTIYHNADADIRKLRENGFTVTAARHARLEDTMLADAVLHSEEDHDLGDLNRRLGRLPDYKHLRHEAPREYNAADLVATYHVWRRLEELFAQDPQAHAVYREQSIPFIDVAVEGEEAGVAVDPHVAWALRDKYEEAVGQARSLALAYTGAPTLNLGSPDQCKQWIHKVYGHPEQTDWEGSVTLDKDAVALLRRLQGVEWDPDEEPTLESALANVEAGGNGLLEAKYLFGGAQQRLTHYVLPCFDGDVPAGRIYPELRLHVQATGRHSYVGPALQQMKGDTAQLIAPDPGTAWVSWDWSQIEVRLLAVLAGDQPYLDAFARGDDIHGLNARAMFGRPGSPELEELRRGFVKRFVFRLHYRGKPENAGDIPGTRALGLGSAGLIAASAAYLAAHPALPPYWAALEREADRTGLVRTFMGRPRRLTSVSPWGRRREACNHPMQGGVADIYCTTALLVRRAAPWARLVFGSHDAQTWQVPEARVGDFVALAAPAVERPFQVNGREVRFPATFRCRRIGE